MEHLERISFTLLGDTLRSLGRDVGDTVVFNDVRGGIDRREVALRTFVRTILNAAVPIKSGVVQRQNPERESFLD